MRICDYHFVKGIGRFREEALLSAPKQIRHAYLSLCFRIYIRREEGNGGRKRPAKKSAGFLRFIILFALLLYLRKTLFPFGLFRSYQMWHPLNYVRN